MKKNPVDLEKQYLIQTYARSPIVIERGKGCWVWDAKGKKYLDFVAGLGVNALGHGHPRILKALREQAARAIHVSNLYYHPYQGLLAAELAKITGMDRAFFCNSGTEAVEGAIKLARAHGGRITKDKFEVVALDNSFHGRTIGALSATGQPKYRKDFEPIVEGFHYVPFNNFEKLLEKVNDQTAAVILEIVQGEGGVHIGDRDYFAKVRKLCNERNLLLIIDEVQTGFCRTGKMFACNHFDLEPDILCLAKAIAGGLPMGAVLCSDKIEAPVGKHGSTFGGNPLVCAAAIAAIDYMLENRLDEQARAKGDYFVEKIEQHSFANVREIRHLGLMIGIELKDKSTPYLLKLMEKGVLALPAGATVLRLLPPLTISYEDLDFVAEQLAGVLPTKN